MIDSAALGLLKGCWYSSAGIQSRTLRVQLPMMLRPNGAQ
jgi:hypothetical protein